MTTDSNVSNLVLQLTEQLQKNNGDNPKDVPLQDFIDWLIKYLSANQYEVRKLNKDQRKIMLSTIVPLITIGISSGDPETQQLTAGEWALVIIIILILI